MTETTALAVALNGKTRSQVAHDAHAKAVDRLESLSIELRSAFSELAQASAQLQKCGVTTEVELPFPLNEAWADWRVKEFTKREVRGENS